MQKIILRPSSVRSFFDTPSIWYKNHILGLDKFEGNTSTYLGTIVHKFAETYYNLKDFNPYEILENAPEIVDKTTILAEYPEMCKQLELLYLSKNNKPELLEHFMELKINDNVVVQGTCDAYDNGVLIDYKTASKVSKDISEYTQQLNIYAYLLSLSKREVHTLRIVRIIRASKNIKPRINILECQADIKKGERLISIMSKKTKLALDNSEFSELIFTENPYSFMSDKVNIETKFIELEE